MNILQILPELNVGGVERGVVDLSRYLKRQGHKIVVVSAGGRLVADLEKEGIRHYTLAVHKKSIFVMIRMVRELSKIIKEEDIQIVHARSRVPAWIGLGAVYFTEKAFITTCHGYYSRHFFSRVMGWPKLVITPSVVIKNHMCEGFMVPEKRIRIVPRSVDLERFKFSPAKRENKEIIVGMAGRIVPLKGHIYFLKAMAKIIRTNPYVRVWIAGDAPENKKDYREDLDTLIRRLGLSSYVEFLGGREDIPQILSKMHVFVFASTKEESFGRVIIEAQAAGSPVVATKIQSATEIIEDGVNGLLVNPKDSDALAEAITRLIKDYELSRKLIENGRKLVESKYTLSIMAEETVRVYKEALDVTNILVIKLGAIGDVILSGPSLRAIREYFPKAKISCLVGARCQDILKNCPYIDELIVDDYRGKDKGILGMLRTAKKLRQFLPEIIVDLQNNRRSHLLGYLSCARSRYGYDNGKLSFLYNHKIKDPDTKIGPIEHQGRTLGMLGIKMQASFLELWPDKEDEFYVNRLLEEHGITGEDILVGLSIGASKRWQTKRWPLENFSEIINKLAKDNIKVIITGDYDDLDVAAKLISMSSNQAVSLCNETFVNQLYCLIKRFRVFVSGDSAGLHVAAAADTRFVALFGPTDSTRHAPSSKAAFRIIEKDIDCRPCYKASCNDMKCMKTISPEEVYQAIRELL
ncbi:MAG: GT4 family glycosyltransferase PelF [Candidatus Omnitrophota bacterium]